ncbi:polyprenyl synthetase family protein [Virgibacillus saliphilus]|uniref:polyprenyl synthetase family protein n=1 Tax=Virgibacillus saliphilus TaxID=2831674 RepID=UPI002814A837|nr:farnesyl diphosphate synthase [Virgibacillus sp. NKC19-3]
MDANLTEYIQSNKKIFQDSLRTFLQKLDIPTQLKESMLYSVEGSGKRLRPILALASYEAYSKDVASKVYSSAAALEFIHTYSLIHDDLPAIDNDDYRRGELTNHKVFDEATAILAGDALLTYSFEIISNDPLLRDNQKVELIKRLSHSSGPSGMVGGQLLDIKAENNAVTLEELENVHALKTGELVNFAIFAGAFLAEATEDQLRHLQEFAYYLGLIFQVQDDILDVTGDPGKVGRPVGGDEENEKSTFPKILGLEGAIQKKSEYVTIAKEALRKANAQDSYLMALTYHFSQRDH